MNRGIAITAAVLVIAAAASPPRAQSLAELAKREEARRKAIKAPAKVLTNDDLPSVPPPAPSSPAADGGAVGPADSGAQQPSAGTETPAPAAVGASTAPAPATAKAEATPSAAATPVKDEAYWRQRMSAARETLSRSQTFQDALQSRINALTADFVSRADPAQRAVISTDRQKALAELDRVKRDIEQAQKEITDTQEEARKAGVPPGWVR